MVLRVLSSLCADPVLRDMLMAGVKPAPAREIYEFVVERMLSCSDAADLANYMSLLHHLLSHSSLG